MLYIIIILVILALAVSRSSGRQLERTYDLYNVVVVGTSVDLGQAVVKPLAIKRGLPLKEALRLARAQSTNGHAAVLHRGRVVSTWCRGHYVSGLF